MKMDSNKKGRLGEDAVNTLANTTYLKYWCFPNPQDKKSDNKEICDLLILFKSSCIIISIKNYAFKGNYNRYFNLTLGKAIKQIRGGERKLFESEGLVFNHPIRGEFKFDASTYTSTHRIIVNINPAPLFYPAHLLTSNSRFTHVYNWSAFLKLVLELDTIPDFIQYLEAREAALDRTQSIMMTGAEDDWDLKTGNEFRKFTANLNPQEKRAILISGHELDLLADYLFNGRKFHDTFFSKEFSGLNIELDGRWEEYMNRKEVKRKKAEEELSYFFDEFIKKEVLHYEDEQRIEIATELLSLSRFERRIAGKQFHDFLNTHKNKKGNYVARRYGQFRDIGIGYFLHSDSISKKDALLLMQLAAVGYSYFTGYKSKKILIIGNNTSLTQTKFALYKDIEPLDKEAEVKLVEDLKSLKWFENIKKEEFREVEYPSN